MIALSFNFSRSGNKDRPANVSEGGISREDPSFAGDSCCKYFSLLLKLTTAPKNASLTSGDMICSANPCVILELSRNRCSLSSAARLHEIVIRSALVYGF